ncbi:MAG: 5-formyltetrahydrofolate cyclo-ligase [Cyanobacteriota bacterium]|nr:5-formyltetrahydrofolate cyclo-ligase [Cyanobacteriota bacterium]
MQRSSKAELRRQFLQERRSLPRTVWRQKSERLCDRLQASPLFARSRTILAYFSFRQEPDLSPLFSRSDKAWGFPRCVGESLLWHCWQPEEALQKGAYGIFEPQPDADPIDPEEVDLILVPSVACDRAGYRLGYGGGFYDRLLSLPEWSSKCAIGIVFDFAFVDRLPVEPWDIPLSGVCSDALLYCGGSA